MAKAKTKMSDAESEFWKRDDVVTNFLEHASNLDDAAATAKVAAKAFRLLAEGRIRSLLPTPEVMMAGLEAADIVNALAVGLLHMTNVAQPDDAALNHHAAFGVWVTDWVHMDLSLAHWDENKFGPKHPYVFAVRVHLSVRPVFSPCENVSGHLLQFPPDDGVSRVAGHVKAAAEAVGYVGPIDTWGGGSWISLMVTGPVHRSYQDAADRARLAPFSDGGWDKVIPPTGWI